MGTIPGEVIQLVQRPPGLAEIEGQRQRERFVGREHELAVFRRALDEIGGRVLYIHGPGGVGKTSLLQAFELVARERGVPFRRIDARDIELVPLRRQLQHPWPRVGVDIHVVIARSKPPMPDESARPTFLRSAAEAAERPSVRKPWRPGDDEALAVAWAARKDLTGLAARFGRSPTAIAARLVHLGVVTTRDAARQRD